MPDRATTLPVRDWQAPRCGQFLSRALDALSPECQGPAVRALVIGSNLLPFAPLTAWLGAYRGPRFSHDAMLFSYFPVLLQRPAMSAASSSRLSAWPTIMAPTAALSGGDSGPDAVSYRLG